MGRTFDFRGTDGKQGKTRENIAGRIRFNANPIEKVENFEKKIKKNKKVEKVEKVKNFKIFKKVENFQKFKKCFFLKGQVGYNLGASRVHVGVVWGCFHYFIKLLLLFY